MTSGNRTDHLLTGLSQAILPDAIVSPLESMRSSLQLPEVAVQQSVPMARRHNHCEVQSVQVRQTGLLRLPARLKRSQLPRALCHLCNSELNQREALMCRK